jgi:hypothetical protein
VSERAPHYCPGCGFDYWRAAAGLGPKPTLVVPAARPPDGRSAAVLMAAGFVGLLITGVVTAVVVLGGGGGEPEAPLIANTLPSRGPEDFLILRFFREARSPYAKFTVAIEGTIQEVDPPGGAMPVTESMVLHGDDWVVHGSYVEADGTTTAVSTAKIDGAYFDRVGVDAPWVRIDIPTDNTDAVSPFARISTVSEVEYVGEEVVSGTALHRLVVTKWLGASPHDMRMLGFDALTQRETRFDIWVNDDGVPIRGRQMWIYSIVEAGATYTFAIDLTMTFSDWGIVEPIEAPDDAPLPPAPAQEPSAHMVPRLA